LGVAACLAAAAGLSFTALAADTALGATEAHEAESMEYGVVDSVDGTLWPKLISAHRREQWQGPALRAQRQRRQDDHARG
jgi:SRSO17 transposase